MKTKEEVRAQCLAFLREHKSFVIATVSPEGDPQISTMIFMLDDDFNFYFVTGRETKKFENIRKNGRVSFVVGTGPAFITVQGGGKAQWIENEDAHKEFMIRLENYVGEEIWNSWPLFQLPHRGLAVIKIKPDWMVFLNLDKEGHPETYREEGYHQIIP